MALLTKTPASVLGVVVPLVAATAGGDTIAVDGPGVILIVKNGDASAKTVTVVRPGTTYGTNDPDIAKTLAAGETGYLGPIPVDFADANGLVAVTYSAVTSVTVGVLRV